MICHVSLFTLTNWNFIWCFMRICPASRFRPALKGSPAHRWVLRIEVRKKAVRVRAAFGFSRYVIQLVLSPASCVWCAQRLQRYAIYPHHFFILFEVSSFHGASLGRTCQKTRRSFSFGRSSSCCVPSAPGFAKFTCISLFRPWFCSWYLLHDFGRSARRSRKSFASTRFMAKTGFVWEISPLLVFPWPLAWAKTQSCSGNSAGSCLGLQGAIVAATRSKQKKSYTCYLLAKDMLWPMVVNCSMLGPCFFLKAWSASNSYLSIIVLLILGFTTGSLRHGVMLVLENSGVQIMTSKVAWPVDFLNIYKVLCVLNTVKVTNFGTDWAGKHLFGLACFWFCSQVLNIIFVLASSLKSSFILQMEMGCPWVASVPGRKCVTDPQSTCESHAKRKICHFVTVWLTRSVSGFHKTSCSPLSQSSHYGISLSKLLIVSSKSSFCKNLVSLVLWTSLLPNIEACSCCFLLPEGAGSPGVLLKPMTLKQL